VDVLGTMNARVAARSPSLVLSGATSGAVTHSVAATTASYSLLDPATAPGAGQGIVYPSGGGQGTWADLGGVPTTRTLTAGAGLTGGGDLSIDRTFNVIAANGSITVNADSIEVGVITDTNHGARGGGTLHSVVTTSVAGFMSAADKTKLDGVATGATNITLSSSIPSTIVVGGSGSAGVASTVSRYDHVHPFPAFGTTSGTICQGNDSRFSNIVYLGGTITTNYLAMFTGSNTIANAPIYGSSGSLVATGNFFCNGYINSTNISTTSNSVCYVGTTTSVAGIGNTAFGNSITIDTGSTSCTAIGNSSTVGTGCNQSFVVQGAIYNNVTTSVIIHASTSSSNVFWVGSKNDFRITTTTPDDLIQAFVTSGRTIPGGLSGLGLGLRVRVDGGGATMGLFAIQQCGVVYGIYGALGF
jgi:hypothetical protein